MILKMEVGVSIGNKIIMNLELLKTNFFTPL